MSLITLFLFSLAAFADTAAWSERWLQIGCALEGPAGAEKNFPGALCLFFDDGSFISANEKSIRKFAPSRAIAWEVPASFHHMISLSTDRKRVLALAEEIKKDGPGPRRTDTFMVIDSEGKILARASAADYMKQLKEPVKTDFMEKTGGHEETHFNSIYEIPANTLEAKLPWMKRGNIIINSLQAGIFVVTPDLSTVLKHMRLDHISGNHTVHDVQVTPEGHFLLFNNIVAGRQGPAMSAIQKVDPVSGRVIFEFTALPHGMFYSAGGGGVQELPDVIFFNHTTTGGYVYSKKTKKIIRTMPRLKAGPQGIQWIQEMKLIDASGFLKHTN